jgi:ATPase subunit of ABC transporter with duplicated ATPase domains
MIPSIRTTCHHLAPLVSCFVSVGADIVAALAASRWTSLSSTTSSARTVPTRPHTNRPMSELVAKPSTHGTSFKFKFPDCERLPPPVMPLSDVSFAYSGDLKEGTVLFRNLDVGVDCDSRIALVGANGSGMHYYAFPIDR